MPKTKLKKVPADSLERAIASRQRGIDRMELNKISIRKRADEQIAEIDRHLAEKRVLLDALKRGQLK